MIQAKIEPSSRNIIADITGSTKTIVGTINTYKTYNDIFLVDDEEDAILDENDNNILTGIEPLYLEAVIS